MERDINMRISNLQEKLEQLVHKYGDREVDLEVEGDGYGIITSSLKDIFVAKGKIILSVYDDGSEEEVCQEE